MSRRPGAEVVEPTYGRFDQAIVNLTEYGTAAEIARPGGARAAYERKP